MSRPQVLETVDAVIDVLGGNSIVQKFTGVPTPQAVYQWRSRGIFPPKLYVLMIGRLKSRNCVAPPALWGMVEGADDVAH